MTEREQITKAISYLETAMNLINAAYFMVPDCIGCEDSLLKAEMNVRELRAIIGWQKCSPIVSDEENPSAVQNIAYAMQLAGEDEEGGEQ